MLVNGGNNREFEVNNQTPCLFIYSNVLYSKITRELAKLGLAKHQGCINTPQRVDSEYF